MRAADIDREVLGSHPSAYPLRAELESLKFRAETAEYALAAATAELHELKNRRLHHLALKKVRGKLAGTVVGKVWRRSKRVAQRVRSWTA
jgi:hypothetical protein